MKPTRPSHHRGFTLIETVIAIAVLTVMLSAFVVVLTPAADGIRKSINLQEANRITYAVEQELGTVRSGQAGETSLAEPATYTSGFSKSFYWIKNSYSVKGALIVYQYRGEIGGTLRTDGTPKPVPSLTGKLPGGQTNNNGYVVVPMCRRATDPLFINAATGDITAIEGGIYLVKCNQLRFSGMELVPATAGTIVDPKSDPPSTVATPDAYPEAVMEFSADFYTVPTKTPAYFTSTAFTSKFATLKYPVFTRNLAVRR